MGRRPGDYSEEDLKRAIEAGEITLEEAEDIRELWETLDHLEDAKKVPRSLLDFEITI